MFVAGMATVLRPGGQLFIWCFSDEEPGSEGPRRISQLEIRDSFHDRWKVQSIEATRFEAIPPPVGPNFSPGGPKSWLAKIERT